MTLRVRLLLLLVAIATVGLVVTDGVTYASLRSFLTTRVDQQLEVAGFPVERKLFATAGLAPASGLRPVPPPGTKATAPRQSIAGPGGRGRGKNGLIVSGTFAELRSKGGSVLAHASFTLGSKQSPAPLLPAHLPVLGPSGSPAFFTVGSGSTGPGYRVMARTVLDGRAVLVVAQPTNELSSTLSRLLVVEVVVSAAVLVGLAALAWLLVRRDTRPIEDMAATATAIAAGDLSLRVSSGRSGSEVGRLASAFNTMIGEIEDAFAARVASEDRLRRFLADASHELRTPLTSIRGYSELFELGMSERPDDLARSLSHVRAEAARMERLVDDLFLLAQLDHERPLASDPVDLAMVVGRSVDSARLRSDGHPITLSVSGPVVVQGDEFRLRQVVDNLVTNAIVHTPQGTAVTIRVGVDGREAVLEVDDRGPGIPGDQLFHIFEPFHRLDRSRSRTTGGAGLGLAIVEAVVHAHGGTVVARPGEGGRGVSFEVRLPIGTSSGEDEVGTAPPVATEAPGTEASTSTGHATTPSPG
ncbi:MAG: sensor histidine kinase [Acidimicrobiales bacterium]